MFQTGWKSQQARDSWKSKARSSLALQGTVDSAGTGPYPPQVGISNPSVTAVMWLIIINSPQQIFHNRVRKPLAKVPLENALIRFGAETRSVCESWRKGRDVFWETLDVFTSGKSVSLLMDQVGNCLHGLAVTTDNRGLIMLYPTLVAASGGTTKTPELPRADTAASSATTPKTIPLKGHCISEPNKVILRDGFCRAA